MIQDAGTLPGEKWRPIHTLNNAWIPPPGRVPKLSSLNKGRLRRSSGQSFTGRTGKQSCISGRLVDMREVPLEEGLVMTRAASTDARSAYGRALMCHGGLAQRVGPLVGNSSLHIQEPKQTHGEATTGHLGPLRNGGAIRAGPGA